jgi:putative endonuclease
MDSERARDPRAKTGRDAEDVAARYLARSGLRIIGRNVRFLEGEIDLVCRDGDAYVFVEVKCRRTAWGDTPAAAVSWWKQRRLVRLAQHYLKWLGVREARCRFDVVAVVLGHNGAHKIRHIRSAFEVG